MQIAFIMTSALIYVTQEAHEFSRVTYAAETSALNSD